MIRWYILFCILAVVHCQSFHTNQHLPLQNIQSPWRYHQPYYPASPSAVAPSKNGYPSETPPQFGDYNDLLRQYQQWQLAIPNQQGGVVYISAPIQGGHSPPSNTPAYPPAPPQPGATPTNENMIVRDTAVTTGGDEEQSSSTIGALSSTPEVQTTSTPSWNASSSTSESTNPVTIGTTVTDSTTVSSNGTSQSLSNSSNPLLKYCKKPRGQFADPSDCSKFINCWDGNAFEQSCPSGLVFNAEKAYCDYPQDVNCTSGNSTSTNPPPSTSPTSNENSTLNSKCPSYYGTHRNASNCAAFYVCVYGEPVDFVCPSGTYYNDNLGVCDYEDRVDCKGAPSTAAPPSSSTAEINSTSPTESSSSSTTNATQSPWSSTESPSSTTSESPWSSSSESISSGSTPETTTSSTTEPTSSTTSIHPEGAGPPGVDPVGLYNLNLKKLPESIVNTGVRCYHQNTLFRLTPDCSSVTICNEGLTYIVNCGQATSFDAFTQRCVPTSRARC